MSRFLTRLCATAALACALPTAALARPVVTVSIGLPPIVVAPPPVVVLRPPMPAPGYVWVEPAWHYDSWGRRFYVQGHWAAPPPVVHHRVVGHRAVVVHR